MQGVSELEVSLNGVFGWHKTRMSCFVRMILGMLAVRSVNLVEVAMIWLH